MKRVALVLVLLFAFFIPPARGAAVLEVPAQNGFESPIKPVWTVPCTIVVQWNVVSSPNGSGSLEIRFYGADPLLDQYLGLRIFGNHSVTWISKGGLGVGSGDLFVWGSGLYSKILISSVGQVAVKDDGGVAVGGFLSPIDSVSTVRVFESVNAFSGSISVSYSGGISDRDIFPVGLRWSSWSFVPGSSGYVDVTVRNLMRESVNVSWLGIHFDWDPVYYYHIPSTFSTSRLAPDGVVGARIQFSIPFDESLIGTHVLHLAMRYVRVFPNGTSSEVLRVSENYTVAVTDPFRRLAEPLIASTLSSISSAKDDINQSGLRINAAAEKYVNVSMKLQAFPSSNLTQVRDLLLEANQSLGKAKGFLDDAEALYDEALELLGVANLSREAGMNEFSHGRYRGAYDNLTACQGKAKDARATALSSLVSSSQSISRLGDASASISSAEAIVEEQEQSSRTITYYLTLGIAAVGVALVAGTIIVVRFFRRPRKYY